jgi:predicted CXXCH cytochrome family protein
MRRVLLPFFVLALYAPGAVVGRAQSVTPNGCASEAGPGTGFSCSPHDFSGANGTGSGGDPATTGACTFCHTPHRALQTKLLWNHNVSSNTFTWSDSTETVGGTPMPSIASTWTGPTKLCLSCHDGSVAIGDIAWFNEQSFSGSPIATTPSNHNGDKFQIATAAGDLKGNHPVAFPYPNFNSAGSTYNGVTTGASVVTQDFSPDPTVYGIRLFNQTPSGVAAGPVAGKTGIECTSCHGVHNEKSSYAFGVQDTPLLRGTKGGHTTGAGASYICMKCHTR